MKLTVGQTRKKYNQAYTYERRNVVITNRHMAEMADIKQKEGLDAAIQFLIEHTRF